jgi:hypothetical protein
MRTLARRGSAGIPHLPYDKVPQATTVRRIAEAFTARASLSSMPLLVRESRSLKPALARHTLARGARLLLAMALAETHPPAAGELRCFYCAYPLTGLAEGHRCPECGRRSVPEDARREVQEIFDRLPALYLANLRVFRKYPYGWWWCMRCASSSCTA